MTSLGHSRHDRAVRILSRRLSEARFDTSAPGVNPASLLSTAIAKDIDALGLSISDAAGFEDLLVLVGLLERCQTRRPQVFVGGRLDPDQLQALTNDPRVHFFTRDGTTREIVAWLELNVTARAEDPD